MNTKQFIKAFNKGNQHDKSILIFKHHLKDPTQHLAIELKDNGPYTHFHILAFSTIRAGFWYVATKDNRRILMTAFPLYPDGEQTFKEWAINVPINFAESIRELFVQTFEHLVLPQYVSN